MSDDPRFSQRRLIIGVTGGIAAYKIATVVSSLAQAGAEVTVVMTEAATRFVTPLTFRTLSGRPVFTSLWDDRDSRDPQHIDLGRSADAMLIAPCSMNTLSRLATGRADDAVSLVAAALNLARQPLLLAPSMNTAMYRQPATRRNLETLRGDGCRIIDPATGWQACRTEGEGRLPEPADLLAALADALNSPS